MFPVVLNYTVFSPNHVVRRWPEDISVAPPNYKFVVSIGGKKINYKKINYKNTNYKNYRSSSNCERNLRHISSAVSFFIYSISAKFNHHDGPSSSNANVKRV